VCRAIPLQGGHLYSVVFAARDRVLGARHHSAPPGPVPANRCYRPRITVSRCQSVTESVRQLPGGGVRKLTGVWPGGRPASQVIVRRLNHEPCDEVFTAESVTATG
jgi:hypothetical protein